MPVGPIDLQSVILGAKETEKVQGTNEARQQHLAHGFNKALKTRLDREAKSVQEVERRETRLVDKESGRGGKGGGDRETQEEEDSEDEEQDVEEQPHGEIYDPHADLHTLTGELERRKRRDVTI